MGDKQKLDEAKDDRNRQEPTIGQIRWFLVRCTVVLEFAILIMYLFTRENTLLLSGTFVFLETSAIYAYYFQQERK